jgi:hypothetical protein
MDATPVIRKVGWEAFKDKKAGEDTSTGVTAKKRTDAPQATPLAIVAPPKQTKTRSFPSRAASSGASRPSFLGATSEPRAVLPKLREMTRRTC